MRITLSWIRNLIGAPTAGPGTAADSKSTVPEPAVSTPFSYTPHFIQYLDELTRKLLPGKTVVLTGMPGVGKTYLAREYGDRLRGQLKEVWVSAGEAKDLRRRIAARAVDFLLDLPDAVVPADLDSEKDP